MINVGKAAYGSKKLQGCFCTKDFCGLQIANRKSTVEMIELTRILLDQYKDESLIYLSAASWHASKAFFAEVARISEYEYRSLHHTPISHRDSLIERTIRQSVWSQR